MYSSTEMASRASIFGHGWGMLVVSDWSLFVRLEFVCATDWFDVVCACPPDARTVGLMVRIHPFQG